MNEKQWKENNSYIVISSFADIEKISPNISSVHFRKFASRKLLDIILENCQNLKSLSFSEYAFKRLSLESLGKIKQKKISLRIHNLRGRPNGLKFYSCPGSSIEAPPLQRGKSFREIAEQLSCNISERKEEKFYKAEASKNSNAAKIREQQVGSSKHLFIGPALKKAAPKSKILSQGSKKFKGGDKK